MVGRELLALPCLERHNITVLGGAPRLAGTNTLALVRAVKA